MDLTTVARIKALISAEAASETSEGVDAEIGAVITTVSGLVERYLNRRIERAATTEYFDVVEGKTIYRLKAYPVTSVASVHFDPSGSFDASTLVASTVYVSPLISPVGALVFRDPLTTLRPREHAALRVVYTGGMADDADEMLALYPDLVGAIDLQIAATWQNRNALGMESAALPEGGSIKPLPDFWIPSTRRVLESYRRVA